MELREIGPAVLYAFGSALHNIMFFILNFVIAQSPDKMKGLVFGLLLAFNGILDFVNLFRKFFIFYFV